MSDQKLLYTIEGDASGLKKAMAEVQAANRQMVDALTRKVGDIGAYKSTQEELTKLSAALTEAKRRRDFFTNSSASGGAAGTKLFADDIARAKQEVLKLAAALQAQQTRLSGLGQSLKSAGIDTSNLAAADARLSNSIRSANAATSSQVAALQKSHAQSTVLKRSLDDVRGAANRLRSAFGPLLATLAAGVGVRGLAQAADGYANLQARLKLAARSQEEFAASNDAVQRIASAAQAPLTETAALYTRIANSLKDTNVSQAAFIDTTEAVALALRLSGASVTEAQSTMLQFSQAIASGVLRGEEFNAVSEAAPRLLQALAVSLNKPVGELRAMAKEGQLTRDVLINGLVAALPTLRSEAEKLPKTLSAAFTEARNVLLLTVGEIDQATGATNRLAKSVIDSLERIRVVSRLIQAGGLFNTLVTTAGASDFGEVLKRTREEIRLTEEAVSGKRARGLDASAFEAKLRGLNAQLQVLIENRVLALQAPPPQTNIAADGTGTNPPTTEPPKPNKAAITAARQEAVALLKAQESLDKARADAAAQGLEDSLTARRERLDQARKAELIDEAGFIAAKAALDEEALRNELAALQTQRDTLRAASTDKSAKGSERTQALADLALVDARIESAGAKILNLNQAATAELAALASAKLLSQAEFLDGLEREVFLSGLSTDERETALLLLEAEKLGITDINRLLELQGQIRANANAKQAADELRRQQDDVYQSVQQGVQRGFADSLNAIATGEGTPLKNAVDALRNALSNALAGSLTDALLNSPLVGGKEGVLGIAGSLGLGVKRDGSNPANAVYVQDIGAAGIAGAGGGLFSGLGNLLSNLFAGIKAAFVSLVSGIGNALSGLFSGGGGSGGSSVGGWVSAIASAFGYAEGGWTGPGSKYQPAGVVHADEFVFDKVATNRIGVAALENMRRIASGGFVSPRPRMSYAEGGLVNLPGSVAPTVNANTKIVNAFDMDSAFAEYLNTRGGERAVLNVIQRNPNAVGG